MAGSAPSAEDGTNGDPAGYPAGVLAAAVLATTGVSFVLVGSAALWLRGEPIPVGDADVVIEPGEQNMQRARAALADMAIQPHAALDFGQAIARRRSRRGGMPLACH